MKAHLTNNVVVPYMKFKRKWTKKDKFCCRCQFEKEYCNLQCEMLLKRNEMKKNGN